MQQIDWLETFGTRVSFDSNVRLVQTASGFQAWSPTQDVSLTIRSDFTTRAVTDASLLWSFRIDGDRKRIDGSDVALVMQDGAADGTSQTFYDRDAGTVGSAIEIASVEIAGQTFVIAADIEGASMGTYEVSPTQAWAGRGTLSGADAPGPVSAMATHSLGDSALIVTASEADGSVSVLRLTSDGALEAVSSLSVADGLPVAAPNDVQIVTGAGGTFIILASAGSDSLTAFVLSASGGLTFVDQIIDSRDTRFDAVVAMDWVSRDGRIFGAVAGADDGISIVELLPSGRFIVHQSIEDTTVLGLTGIADLVLTVTATGLEVLTISPLEESLTRFDLTVSGGIVTVQNGVATGGAADELLIGGDGSDLIDGGDGVDVLVDGAGVDTMYGGAGGDLFVLGADGQVDRIYDFDISEDRLDLSAWGMLYSVDQLTIQSRSNGALLSFGTEVLHLVSHDGRRLKAVDFADLVLLTAQHVTVWEPLSDGPVSDPGIEVFGTDTADSLQGGSGTDTIVAMGGDDVILATAGDDSIDGGSGRDILSAELAAEGMTLTLGGAITGVEDLMGSAFGDALTGDGGGNLIDGGMGDDTLSGGAGSDTLMGGGGSDRLDGGSGSDWVSYADATAGVFADLSNGTAASGAAAGDTFLFIENLIGGSGNDTLIGSDGANHLIGGDGNDSLSGGLGDDTLAGDAGKDTLIGGGGDDLLTGGGGDDLLIADDVTQDLLDLYF